MIEHEIANNYFTVFSTPKLFCTGQNSQCVNTKIDAFKGAMTSEDLPGTQFLRHSVHQFGQSKEFHDSQEKRAEEILAKSILVRTLSDSKLDAICDFNDDIERKTLPNNLNRRKVT